jgi:hypothetical protein
MTDIPIETDGIKRIRTTKTMMGEPVQSMVSRNRPHRPKPAMS